MKFISEFIGQLFSEFSVENSTENFQGLTAKIIAKKHQSVTQEKGLSHKVCKP